MKPSLRQTVLGGGTLLMALLFIRGPHSQGEQPRRETVGQAASGPTRLYFGIAACRQCHTRPGELEPVLCRCTEAAIWGEEDKHRDAFQVLRGGRAKTIGDLLGYQGPVWQAKECVSCHGVWIEDPKLRHSTFKDEDGVSCVACHGAAREWVALHGDVLERDRWRGYSRKLKEEKFGMKDLWDPAKRARLCLSCHLGNTAEGKVVTHTMYAAGHPPLPGVELATFSDAMPRHWQYVREKRPEVRKMLRFDAGEAAFEQTKLVAVGSIVVLREALELLASQAALAVPEKDPKVVWPELAQFDCAACHHELQKPTWRPKPGTPGPPGQPRAPRWPFELAGVVLECLGGEASKDFHSQTDTVQRAFRARPFGSPREIALAARQTVNRLDQWLPQVSARPYDRATALQLLRQLGSIPPDGVPDYDSARQRAWAFQIIYHEMSQGPGPKPANDRAIRQIFATFAVNLGMQLPAGRKQSIEGLLPEGMKKRENYGPAEFRRAFGELVKLLPQQ